MNAPFRKSILAMMLGLSGPLYAQHDQNIANADGATVRADINNALAALFTLSSGSSAPTTTIAYMLWADTTNNLLKQRNAANLGWIVRGTLAESFVTARSSNTILGVADFGKFFRATSGFTQTLTAAATLIDGWFCFYRVESGATLTLDPNGSETIDGATTKDFVGPCSGVIVCSGAAFFSYGFDNPAATQSIAGVIATATQAQQETASSTSVAVSPGVQQFHPSAAKSWVYFTNAGTPTVAASYNVSSLSDNGVGDTSVTLTVSMSSANYPVLRSPMAAGTYTAFGAAGSSGVYNVRTRIATSGTDVDIDAAAAIFGDQ